MSSTANRGRSSTSFWPHAHNVYVQYQFDRDAGPWSRTRFRIGARNVFDKDPPLTSDGYNGFLHRPHGRYWYASVNKRF